MEQNININSHLLDNVVEITLALELITGVTLRKNRKPLLKLGVSINQNKEYLVFCVFLQTERKLLQC